MLIKVIPEKVFDLDQVQPGYLVYGKHKSWNTGKSGIVAAATDRQLIVQYHPGIGNVTNHFIIPVSEAAAGEWKIRCSSDLSAVFEYAHSQETEETDEP